MKKRKFFLSIVLVLTTATAVGGYFYLKSCGAICTKKQSVVRSSFGSEYVAMTSGLVEEVSQSTLETLPSADSKPSGINKKIQWMNFTDMQKRIKQNPKKVFVDIYTDWCGWCKVLEKKTYTKSHLIDYLNENYYSVKFNGEQKQNVNFAGQEFKFIPSGRSGYHELTAALTEGRLSYPMLVFIDEKLNPITYVAGFQEADELMDILVYLNEEHYKSKNMSFRDFKKTRARGSAR